ncbi:Glycoside hydrolase family 43, partial [Penicillium angulare]|uniref:Glycoside hydrolase family 43 n=1 Tax=Penicillium angulare TaxID=116970 RepID=UPI0025424130
MHLTTNLWLLSLMLISPLSGATPSTQPIHKASQVYDTTDQLPLPNKGNIAVHDPNILLWENYYYLFKGGFHIPIFRTQNLTGPWEQVGTVLSQDSIIDMKNRSRPWAPTTIQQNGTFYCYYSVSQSGSQDSAIGVATSTSLDSNGGKWTDHGAVIRTGKGTDSHIWPYNITNAIDPSFITDNETGASYLNFGSFWHDIWQVPLSENLLSVQDSDAPDAKQLTFIPEQKQKPEEGSWMSFREGYYYAWFSHGQCCQFRGGFPARGHEYDIRVGRSESVRGPFLDRHGDKLLDGGGTIVYASNHGEVYAPGGLGVLAGNDSVPDILYYHYLNTTVGFRNGEAHLGWNYLRYDDGWPVVLDGIDISSSAGSILPVPRWLALTISM